MSRVEGLNFLGMGSAFNPAMDNTSAWFTEGGTFYLLDCGETVFGKIWNLEEFKQAHRIAVILTHMHCDHVGSLGTLLSYCAIVVNKPVEILYPSHVIRTFLALVGIAPSFFIHHDTCPSSWNVQFRPTRVDHAEDMECYGYTFAFGGKRLYYSGDSSNIPNEVLTQLLDGNIDVVFQDTSLTENEHHCPLAVLEASVPSIYRHKVIAMHLPDHESIDAIQAKGFRVVHP